MAEGDKDGPAGVVMAVAAGSIGSMNWARTLVHERAELRAAERRQDTARAEERRAEQRREDADRDVRRAQARVDRYA